MHSILLLSGDVLLEFFCSTVKDELEVGLKVLETGCNLNSGFQFSVDVVAAGFQLKGRLNGRGKAANPALITKFCGVSCCIENGFAEVVSSSQLLLIESIRSERCSSRSTEKDSGACPCKLAICLKLVT